jgi:hypothetical protein
LVESAWGARHGGRPEGAESGAVHFGRVIKDTFGIYGRNFISFSLIAIVFRLIWLLDAPFDHGGPIGGYGQFDWFRSVVRPCSPSSYGARPGPARRPQLDASVDAGPDRCICRVCAVQRAHDDLDDGDVLSPARRKEGFGVEEVAQIFE